MSLVHTGRGGQKAEGPCELKNHQKCWGGNLNANGAVLRTLKIKRNTRKTGDCQNHSKPCLLSAAGKVDSTGLAKREGSTVEGTLGREIKRGGRFQREYYMERKGWACERFT